MLLFSYNLAAEIKCLTSIHSSLVFQFFKLWQKQQQEETIQEFYLLHVW